MEEVGTSERLDEREKINSSKTWKTPKNFDCFGIRTPNSMRLMKIRDLSFLDPFQLQYHSSMPCWFDNSNQKPVGDFPFNSRTNE